MFAVWLHAVGSVSVCVWMCDMCLFLDGVIRGNYNATVSTAGSASLFSDPAAVAWQASDDVQ